MYNWPQRKRIRMKWYDYSSEWWYFITICTKNHVKWFGNVSDWKMNLNKYGRIVEKCWYEIPNHYNNCVLDEFVIMPNHVHGILFIGDEYIRPKHYPKHCPEQYPIHSIPNIIKWFKIGITKEIKIINNEQMFQWHRSYHDRIIRDNDELDRIRKYIIENPLKWDLEKNININLDK